MNEPLRVLLDFGEFKLPATLFDTAVARRFYECLPRTVELTYWGREAYGSIGIDLGAESPVPKIPAGGLAYTNRGDYLCVFFGQTPAWDVEHVGALDNDAWKILLERTPPKVTVTAI